VTVGILLELPLDVGGGFQQSLTDIIGCAIGLRSAVRDRRAGSSFRVECDFSGSGAGDEIMRLQ
jgi:hypothetical protein